MRGIGKVSLIGAGPGDPDLLTVKALKRIQDAEVVVYDRLVSQEIMDLVPPKTALYPVGKKPKSHPIPQEEINQLLVDLAKEGKRVVRLKGGDPFIFGRGSEEAAELVTAGVEYEVVPGITAAQGCASSLNLPLTHRGLATGLRYVTGHCQRDVPLDLDWASLADPNTTLVIYMGLAAIAEISTKLVEHGMPAEMPAVAISKGTTSEEQKVFGTLTTIGELAKEAKLPAPTLFMIGDVVGLKETLELPEITGSEGNWGEKRPHLEVING
ncbi:Siroheme synthase (Uroporphyrinogen-III C-methyltransferase/Precorrin-2 dehydrogenase/Sirohydrochlorin ferrochelatase) [Pseudovibrio sp. FO-BEG1]|uniref:uroporphyrinogen-III C-methyltransferase n=1 Tax=Pseudovibrio sp. (strain FO-BEG1) TaxID=911045 RepID=UPI000238C6F5|nr:uroporphyrinogen-III C-methyltransferase [Pseudovibrio sp. FO-BEG1]AEV36711.1 Siroheme synthase (Uroporphyrinogen-III C-methyltransferase/Precorrin-2 dehydrogenase/Sirohydrochlorin ferrochelatase) [Pseudovibrio sp. FO-BEG1]